MTALSKTGSFALIFTILFIYSNLSAQDPFPEYAPIYRDDVIARVDVNLPADSLAVILAPGNEESEYHFHATFIFNNSFIHDTFENAGFQLRGNTSRYAAKKSFQVSLNKYVPGRLWYGVEKINLNGEHNDPTVSRSKIAWDLLREMGVPAPRSNHVELYINGAYFGLYANIEHIDEEFVQTRFGNKDGNLYKCLWPADLDYLGDDPELYKYTSGDRRAYELKTNEEKDDYSDLAHFIDVLNNTPVEDLQCELELVFNVNSYLKSMAFDVLSGNWDGPLYNKNNFFLYHNQATGLFEYIPYDLDNTFGIDWFGVDWSTRNIYEWGHPTEPRPLYYRLLEVKEYRDRFSYFLDRFIDEIYREDLLFSKLNELRISLRPSLEDDTYYPKDYGFTIDDFWNGFEKSLPFPHTPIGIKHFIVARKSATINQLEPFLIGPIISEVRTNHPEIFEEILITAHVEDVNQTNIVDLFVQYNGTGPFQQMRMFDDGFHLDGVAGDRVFGILLPAPGECVTLNFKISSSDVNGGSGLYPTCNTRELVVCGSALKLAVNEFMASNETTITDDHGEPEDWIEIYNYGTESIYLGELYLTDKPDNPTKWAFPDTTIEAGAYMLIWADEDTDQGPLHADIKLSAGGEYVGLYDNDASENALIDGYEFGTQETDVAFGRWPNGTGPFQAMVASPGNMNQIILSTLNARRITANIYPNPAREVVYITTNQAHGEDHAYKIVNVLGQAVLEKFGQHSVMFDVKDLANGIYLVTVQRGAMTHAVGKFLKQQ